MFPSSLALSAQGPWYSFQMWLLWRQSSSCDCLVKIPLVLSHGPKFSLIYYYLLLFILLLKIIYFILFFYYYFFYSILIKKNYTCVPHPEPSSLLPPHGLYRILLFSIKPQQESAIGVHIPPAFWMSLPSPSSSYPLGCLFL